MLSSIVATVVFDEQLDIARNLNTLDLLWPLNLQKALANLFVQISTAYVADATDWFPSAFITIGSHKYPFYHLTLQGFEQFNIEEEI